MVSDPVLAERRALVVGATGILRPAAMTLLAGGDTVVAVARGRVKLTALEAEGGRRLQVAPLDITRPDLVCGATGAGRPLAGPWDAALVYEPRRAADEFEQVLRRVGGRVVRILPSAAGTPTDGEQADPLTWTWSSRARRDREVRLLLGWTGPADAPRWHTPEEVSAAALDTLERGEDTVLGRIRPWSDRP